MFHKSTPPADFVKFNGELKLYREVLLFCFPRGASGCLRERIAHPYGTIDQQLIVVKVGDTLYRYSPKKLDNKISQVQLALTIGKKLRSSKRQRIVEMFTNRFLAQKISD
jgi:hypothetical protein